MSGTICIPPNKTVMVKIVYPPPDHPFEYGLKHFNSKQVKLIRKMMKKVSEKDLNLQKFFHLYGIYALDRMKKSIEISHECENDVLNDLLVEKYCSTHEYEVKFHDMYKSDGPPSTDFFDFFTNREYERVVKLKKVSKALDAIYMARFYQK